MLLIYEFIFIQTANYVVLVAYERYVALCQPFEYKIKFTRAFRKKVMIFAILLPIFATALTWGYGFVSTIFDETYVANWI